MNFSLLFPLVFVSLFLSGGSHSGNITPDPSAFSGKDVTSEVFEGEASKNIFPVAFIDFNSDKMTDILAIGRNRSSLLLFLAHETPPFFRQASVCHLNVAPRRLSNLELYEEENIYILGVTPGDFTGDGLVDVLVSVKQLTPSMLKNKSLEDSSPVQVLLLPGNLTHVECISYLGEGPDEQTIKMVQEPLVLDLDGDLVLDLIGEKWVDKPTRFGEEEDEPLSAFQFDEFGDSSSSSSSSTTSSTSASTSPPPTTSRTTPFPNSTTSTTSTTPKSTTSSKTTPSSTSTSPPTTSPRPPKPRPVIKHGKRTLWLFNQPSGHLWKKRFHYLELPFKLHESQINRHKKDSDSFLPMSVPHASAWVDTDGDTVPELVLTTWNLTEHHRHKHRNASSPIPHFFIETYKVVRSESASIPDISFILVSSLNLTVEQDLKNVIGQPIFMDIDQSGNLAHLVPYCGKLNCEGSSRLGIVSNGTFSTLPVEFKDEAGIDWIFMFTSRNTEHPYHNHSLNLRMGDYNLDGYPDLLATLFRANHSDNGYVIGKPVILENVPCTKGPEIQCNFPRTFKANFGALAKYNSSIVSAFFDLNEDGLLDVIGVRKLDDKKKLAESEWEVFAFQNSPYYDANFLKVMVVTGKDCLHCPIERIPYGNIISGPLVSYETETTQGEDQRAVSAQFYRSAHFPLDVPFTLFGLGSVPNFINTLKISLSSPDGSQDRDHEWTQVIPNSQIIIIPAPLNEPHWWKAKLFLTPSKGRLNTFGVLLGFSFLFGFLVLILQWRERREDKRERALEAHRFHIM